MNRPSFFPESARTSAIDRTKALRITTVALLALVASLFAPVVPAHAQGGTIAGVVLDRNQTPLPNAQVTVRGTRLGAITDATGHFRISGVEGTTATLDVRRLGYKITSIPVSVGATDATVSLEAASVNLDAVVVTGQPISSEKRTLGVDIAQIDASKETERAPINNVQQLLNGRAAGVTLLQNSGVIGSGATVRIRGVSSFSLSNQPLVYVDGVRVDNAQSTGPTNQGFGASTTSRWNDFNPDDIESIEIVKGPAAATLYGTEASNGVIQIITKKGGQGKPVWDLTLRHGLNQFADQQNRVFTNWGPDPVTGQIVSVNMAQREAARGEPIFTSGHLQSYDLGVSGGAPLFRYRLSGNYEDNRGVRPDNRDKHFGGRANLSVIPNEKFQIESSLSYLTGHLDLPWEAGAGGTTWTTYYATPRTFGTPLNGFYGDGTPAAYLEEIQTYQDINRFTGGVQITHNPVNWFTQRLTLGTDQGLEDNQELAGVHHDLAIFFTSGPNADSGYKEVSTRQNTLSSLTYGATLRTALSSVSAATSFGADFYRRSTKYFYGYGEDFPGPGLTALASTTSGKVVSETSVQNNTVGVYVQEQLGLRDRMFLTGGLRSDNNSSFGSNFKRVYYPKVSAAWVVSEEPFFRLPYITTLKLRSAYGQTGQAPTPYSAVAVFSAVTGPGGSAAVTPLSLGNPDLGPERGYETEMGFDAGLLGDRAGIEFTYFSGGTRNAILEKQVAPSTGYPGTQLVNAGKLTKHGFEAMVRATPVSNETTTWDVNFSIGTNHTKVVDLGGAQFITPGGNVQHHVGYPVGSWFGKRVVDATIDPTTGLATAVFCDPGTAGGAPVLCGSAPVVYLGNTTPTSEGAFGSTLTFLKNFSLFTLVDFKRGYSKLDGNRRVRCHLFNLCRENYFPKEFSPVTVGTITSGAYLGDLVNDASYTKLREISLNYNLPAPFASRFGASRAAINLAGRNLHTWTNYSGLEPEASFQGGSRGFGQWEQAVTPQLRSWIATLRLTY